MPEPWNSYQREQYDRLDALEAEHQVDINDEHFDVLFVDDGPFVYDRDMRYPFAFLSPYHYSRLQFPLAPKFPVPINPGIFTAISSWFDPAENQIKSARQLVMLSYAGQDGDEEVTGIFLTVYYNVKFGLLDYYVLILMMVNALYNLGGFPCLACWWDLFPILSSSLHRYGWKKPAADRRRRSQRSSLEGFAPSALSNPTDAGKCRPWKISRPA